MKNPEDPKSPTVVLLMPKAQKAKWGGNNIKDMLVNIVGSPIPITLTAVCSAKELDCAIPNCTIKSSAWHHIKHRKKYKGNHINKAILSYTAKQIPLCKDHHTAVHNGTYGGPSLRKLIGYSPSDFD